MDPKEGLRGHLHERGLDSWADRLLATERTSLRLVPASDGLAVARLGGRPRLPASEGWPEVDGAPLSFVAEVDLALASAALREGGLPASGLLQFYYDAEQAAWGFDPKDRLRWRVLHVPADAPARDFPTALGGDARFKEIPLRTRRESTFAPYNSRLVESLGIEREARFEYGDALEAWASSAEEERGLFHRLFGHPEQIQNEMTLECQLASNGIYVGEPSGYETEAAKRLESGAAAWQLLLQIDSDDQAGMTWGDVGRLYYWIRDADLIEHHWDRVWMILQCY